MSAQLIAYELKSPGQDYSALYAAIKELGAWWHYLHSSWIVDTSLSASQIRTALSKHIDANDLLLVVSLGGEWASYLPSEANDWLNQHVS